jgi:hypothetical protein
VATYTLDWSETNLGGSAVVSYAAGAVLDFTDKPSGATAALSLTANQGGSANVTIAEFSIETSGSSVMTFAYHTSSESGWDKLHIDVDGVSQANYSGATAWTTHAGISIASAGTHTIRFRYQKDGSGDTDADRVWVALLNITNTVTVNDASGSATTYNMEDGAIPSAVTTSDWTNSTSEPIAGTRSLRSPAATAASGSYDLEITQPAAADYTVVAFDWKVSSEFNYDEIYLFPDAAAANVPASGAPSSAGSPGWLDYNDEAAGRLGFIIPPAGRTVLVRYAKDAGTDGGSDAAWIDNLSLPAATGSDGSVTGVAATASGQAPAPSFSGAANATSVTATATAQALAPSVSASSAVAGGGPAVATAAAVAPNVSTSSVITAVTATSTGTALAPAASGSGTSADVSAVTATSTGTAHAPSISGESTVTGGGPATATMQAQPPTFSAGSVIAAIAATVTVVALAPSVSTTGAGQVAAVRATATAAAPPPSVSASSTVTATLATSTATAVAPSASGTGAATVAAVTATASADAWTPSVSAVQNVNVAAIVAGAAASAVAPLVTTYDTPTVTPASRTLVVPAETRVLVVPAENRTLEA